MIITCSANIQKIAKNHDKSCKESKLFRYRFPVHGQSRPQTLRFLEKCRFGGSGVEIGVFAIFPADFLSMRSTNFTHVRTWQPFYHTIFIGLNLIDHFIELKKMILIRILILDIQNKTANKVCSSYRNIIFEYLLFSLS